MRTIRASEIGLFLYCNRAWWYQQHGVESQNQASMEVGTRLHAEHGRRVFLTGLLRTAGVICLVASLALLAAALTITLLG